MSEIIQTLTKGNKMRVVRVLLKSPQDIASLTQKAMDCGAVARSFSIPDDFPLDDFPALEVLDVVPTLPKEAGKAGKPKAKRTYPSVKVEISGGLAGKLESYSGNDEFIWSVKNAWKKWGKLSPGQIFWIEKKLGAA